MNVVTNQLLYILTKNLMTLIILHFVYTLSPRHFYAYAALFIVQESLNLFLQSRIKTLQEQYAKGVKHDERPEEKSGPSSN